MEEPDLLDPQTVCTPSTASAVQSKDYDRDGVPAYYATYPWTITLHPDGSYGWVVSSKRCWLAGDLDDDGQQRPAAPSTPTPASSSLWGLLG